MKKHIAEDLPARKHPQAQLSSPSKSDGNRPSTDRDDKNETGEKTPEQKVRQAVYDIRYRARRENLPLRSAYSQYMQNSSMGEAEKSEVRKKLFGKEGGTTQAENFDVDMKRSASDSMAKALYKVFVEKKDNTIDVTSLKNELEEAANETAAGKKYKVRVTDKESGVTYIRYATREKISQLRAKGLEVEMTEYGTPYEGERTKGEKTAEVLGKKAKRDYDGDGKVESGAKEYRGAVHNAIQRKRGGVPDGRDTSSVKEEYIGEVATTSQSNTLQSANPDTNPTQIDFTTKKNKITVNPTDSSQTKLMSQHEILGDVIIENGYSKFLEMLQEKKMTKSAKKKEKKLKTKYDPSGMKASMKKQYGAEQGEKVYFATIRKQAMKEGSECGCEDEDKDKNMDSRSLPTAINLAKNRARAMGAKNPIVMVASENIESGPILPGERGKRVFPKGQEPKATGAKLPTLQKAQYDPEGEVIDETKLGWAARAIENREARKGGLRRTRSKKEVQASKLGSAQLLDKNATLERQKAPGDTGLHKGAERPKSEDEYSDEAPRRRRTDRDDHPSLTARERNPNLR
jgi:hypothetical protein